MHGSPQVPRTAVDRALRRLAVAVAGLAAVLAILVAARLALYRQTDDREHLESKRRYLERIAGTTRTSDAGLSVVVVLFDDLGYGDLGVYGSESIRTPNLDRLAAEGVRFTDAYSASPYCSASRAGLLTGRYAARTGLDLVIQAPGSFRDGLLRLGWRKRRLPAEEITLAEVLGRAGRATAAFGKWHLGSGPPALPGDFGFDHYYGLLHSNDQGEPRVWQDGEVVEDHPIDQSTLTRRYTERAVAFLEAHRDRPFFLYLPHTFPHVPLHAGPGRAGTSAGGLYGDVVEELDDSVGSVVEALERLGRTGDTLVVITSDNGPWFQGSAGASRGRKLEVFEGGMRVPLIVRWPGHVDGGRVIDEPVIAIDLFPTVLELAGLPLPGDRIVDGESLAGVLTAGGPAPRRPIFYHQLGAVRAVRSGRFKYHDRHRVGFGNPMDWPLEAAVDRGPWLFDLALDPRESYDVAAKHPRVTESLRELLEARQREIDGNPRGWL